MSWGIVVQPLYFIIKLHYNAILANLNQDLIYVGIPKSTSQQKLH